MILQQLIKSFESKFSTYFKMNNLKIFLASLVVTMLVLGCDKKVDNDVDDLVGLYELSNLITVTRF